MKPHLGISVIVCTYNRSRLLADALQSLCEQTLSSSKFEIIVVDNNSRDDTRTVMEEYIRYYPNVRYCFEPQQGLSHARNRGWQNAQGEYVAYVDDDCRMPPGWLAMAQIVIKQIAPGAFGGPYFPFYNSTKPH